jgi:hypothetical protein
MTSFGVGDCYLIGLVRKDVRANDLRRGRTPINRWLEIRHFLDGVRRGPGRNGHSNFSCSSRGISALPLLPPKNFDGLVGLFCAMARAPLSPRPTQ